MNLFPPLSTCVSLLLLGLYCAVDTHAESLTINGWCMQDAALVRESAERISTSGFVTGGWYKATVPGTVLTTLVNDGVYPEPLYGENMRRIPERLNKTNYWYRSEIELPVAREKGHTWLHFGGINYAADVWVNGTFIGTIRGAFMRGDFDVSEKVRTGKTLVVAVLVHPEPHPGTPHEHTRVLGVGKNGGETALDGPTFLSTIGWDWIPAIRDRDSGIWLPVTMDNKGPVRIVNPFVTSRLSDDFKSVDLTVAVSLQNDSSASLVGTLVGLIRGNGLERSFRHRFQIKPASAEQLALDPTALPELHIDSPALWWPNGYGKPDVYSVEIRAEVGGETSDAYRTNLGIRRIEYSVPGSEFLTISVNGVKVMIRGGDWGLDEALKRIPRERLDAQFRMHAQAHLNMIRNWVGQSTSPDFYDLADRYGILLWDEFFQPNPLDGPDVADLDVYMNNARDKVLRYRNHPSIAVWCARNEGYPPKALDEQLRSMMSQLDPTRIYQSNSADGRGVSSHGPYYWRSPRYFYALNEAFKTETGSVSVPTIESIQGMMPQKDWETINDDWAQHDMASGAQRGNEYPFTLAKRYGNIRNLADFVRKAQIANFEAFRAMYEGRNAKMFTETTGVMTWMSQPAQPSFVWQLYHYDLEPNSSLFAVQSAGEQIHVQLNEADRSIQVVNNAPTSLQNLTVRASTYNFDGSLNTVKQYPVAALDGSSVQKAAQLEVDAHITPIFFLKLDLTDSTGSLISTNFYWLNVAQDDFAGLQDLPNAALTIHTSSTTAVSGRRTIEILVTNGGRVPAILIHFQLHRGNDHDRVLPVFYSNNYITLVPGETRSVTVECADTDLRGQVPELQVDGFNVELGSHDGSVIAKMNENALPSHWPVSDIVPLTAR